VAKLNRLVGLIVLVCTIILLVVVSCAPPDYLPPSPDDANFQTVPVTILYVQDGNYNHKVTKFVDGPNTCYIYSSNGISCVKTE